MGLELQKIENNEPLTSLMHKAGLIKKVILPTLPLQEQQRIVAILDKVFAAIATAKENAQQNRLNAKEIFESYLQNGLRIKVRIE